MIALFNILLTSVGVLLFYLTSTNQRLLRQPLAHAAWPWLATTVTLLSLLSWMQHADAKAGFFAVLVIIMLVTGLLPQASLLRSPPANTSASSAASEGKR